jgi:hypothetical protein
MLWAQLELLREAKGSSSRGSAAAGEEAAALAGSCCCCSRKICPPELPWASWEEESRVAENHSCSAGQLSSRKAKAELGAAAPGSEGQEAKRPPPEAAGSCCRGGTATRALGNAQAL